jgi:NAD(P)-dependent dehydrogenase (short-subunit alcohol dehydrogenase family)
LAARGDQHGVIVYLHEVANRGIGRAMAQAFMRGNKVTIAGRRQSLLDDVTTKNLGMASVVLDIKNREAIRRFAAKVAAEFPASMCRSTMRDHEGREPSGAGGRR